MKFHNSDTNAKLCNTIENAYDIITVSDFENYLYNRELVIEN